MGKKIDLTGKKFGRLTVLGEAESRVRNNGKIAYYWKCRCDCGTEKEIEGRALREGTTVSCGCWRSEKAKANLIGQKFTYLTVLKEAGRDEWGSVIWLCKCDCGNYHKTLSKYLLNGDTTSCGCRRAEFLIRTHDIKQPIYDMSDTRLYRIWRGIKQRCLNPNSKSYKNYGGRGIDICLEWNDFENFYKWAIENGYEESLTIDRINNNGNYEPSNCRWVSRKIQGNNTRRNHYLTYKGITKTMSEWADICNIKYSTVRARINSYHWSIEKALETPVRISKVRR